MAEQTANEELETLRKTVNELVAKNSTRKQRITELESTVADLQVKLTEREATLRAATVDKPLKAMSESISTAPELWLEQLSKFFKVELIEDKLTLLTIDGKPVADKDGNSVPFERDALSKFLTDGDDARAKAFRALTITSRASGAAGPPIRRTAPIAPNSPQIKFGLR